MLPDTKRGSPEIREGEAPAEPDLAWARREPRPPVRFNVPSLTWRGLGGSLALPFGSPWRA